MKISNWYYYGNGQKHGTVTGGQLKGLAKAGVITPETLLETEDGKSVLARQVRGLTFGEAAPSDEPATFTFPCPNCQNTLQAKKKSAGKTKSCPTCREPFTVPAATIPAPQVETETYGLASQSKPSPEPSPFTASMSEVVDKPIAAPPETANPFTASMPIKPNPFSPVPPISLNDHKQNSASIYFYIDADSNRRGPWNKQHLRELEARGLIGLNTPIETSTGQAGRAREFPDLLLGKEPKSSFNSLALTFIGLGSFMLVVIGIGISNAGGGGGRVSLPASAQSVYRGQFTAAERAAIETFARENQCSVEELAGLAKHASQDSGMTILHIAAAIGNVPVAKFLILHGADVNSRDNEGYTPLDLSLRHATMKRYIESVGGRRGS